MAIFLKNGEQYGGCRRRWWHPTPVLLPGKSHGQRSLVGYSPWGFEESDTTEWLHFHFSLSCIGEGNGNQLQCSCLENPRDRGDWWGAIYGVTQSQTRLKWFSSSACMYKATKKSREMVTIKMRMWDHHADTKTRQRYQKRELQANITDDTVNHQSILKVNPKGNQSWIFIGRTDDEAETPILWPPDVKNWLIGKDPDAGKVWRQEEKGTTEDEVVGWYHQLDGHEFE